MQGTLAENLNKLVFLLAKIIEFINDNKLVTSGTNSEKFEVIKNHYKALTHDEIDVPNYDFQSLKRNVNAIIHPDLKATRAGKDNNVENQDENLASRFNGAIVDIVKEQKQMKLQKSSFFWSYNYKSAEEKNEKEVDQKDGTDEFIETIKELWDLLVHKIPRNENDYFKIKENYEKLMNKLNSKIVNKTNLINELNHDIKKLKEDWKKGVTPDAIDLIYNQELEELNLKLNNAIEEEKRISRSVERAKETLFDDPFYLEEFKNRVYNLQIEIIGMKREYQLIQNAGPRFANKKYGNSKITYAERKAQIERKLKIFPDIKAVEKYVRRELINEDRFYQARVNDLEKIKKKVFELRREIDYYNNNGPKIYKEIADEITEDFGKKCRTMLRKRNLMSSKKKKLKIKLETINGKYEDFLKNYQNIYERANEKSSRR